MHRVRGGLLCCLVVGVLGAVLGVGAPTFDEVTLDDLRGATLSSALINASLNNANQIPNGTIMAYQTDEGRYGVLEVVSSSSDLTLNWRTYNATGSVCGSGYGLVVRRSYTCDLDRGMEGATSADFQWSIVNNLERYIEPRNGAQFALLSSLPEMMPGGVYAPDTTTRVAYSVAPPQSIELVIPKLSLHFDLRTTLPWSQREWTQYSVYFYQPGSTQQQSKTFQCSCKQHYLQNWQVKPSTYWPHATQYLVSDPTGGHWDSFALCIDVPNLTWGAGLGYGVSLVSPSTFSSFRAGDGVTVPASQKHPITPAPSVETGPVSARGGTISSPYEVFISFDNVAVEWFRWNNTARLRAGNVVLYPNLGAQWHASNPNAIWLGKFLVDLAAGTVQWGDWKRDGTVTLEPTPLTVTMDDSPGDFVPFEPHLWY